MGGVTSWDDALVEKAAREAFWTDDIGGHHKPGSRPHTWENIPEVGRENYRTLIRAVLAAVLPDVEARAEQRGREDNADHGMCYVHGSAALAAHDADVRAQVAEEIAAAIERVRDQWERDRSGYSGYTNGARLARDFAGTAHPRSP